MGSKRSYFICNFFIFLIENFALSLIQLLLLIFSKSLDNFLSVCGALHLQICIYRKYAFRFAAFSFLFVALFNLIPNRGPLFSLLFFLSSPFAFRSKMLKSSNFYMCLLDFIYTCHFCFI